MHSKRDPVQPRRRHGADLKAKVLAACVEPGASVAAVAQAHGLNANLVHKWRRGCGAARVPVVAGEAAPEFVPVSLLATAPAADVPVAAQAPAEIRIDLKRGATTVRVCWPASAASQCAAWLGELLR